MTGTIAIVDYGVGNLASVRKAFAAIGAPAELVRDPARLRDAGSIVLPGVGNFGHCARELERFGFVPELRAARERMTPLLGICVGMQLLFDGSEEDRGARGLGFFRGAVARLSGAPRVPQIGWNAVRKVGDHPWLRDVADGDHFYFVHGYTAEPDEDVTLATDDYGGERVAIAGRDGVLGVQFHPEKSGANGLRLLRAFAAAGAAVATGRR